MKIKTIFTTCLLLLVLSSGMSCASTKAGKNPETVAEAEKMRAKEKKKAAKDAKKFKKAAYKAHWDLQSKAAKKSIKRNKKRHRKNNDGKRIVP